MVGRGNEWGFLTFVADNFPFASSDETQQFFLCLDRDFTSFGAPSRLDRSASSDASH